MECGSSGSESNAEGIRSCNHDSVVYNERMNFGEIKASPIGEQPSFEVSMAANRSELASLEEQDKDPIIVPAEPHEVGHQAYVFTKSPKVLARIRRGNNWHMGEEEPDAHGYVCVVYNHLNPSQLAEHLLDPSKYEGED